MVITNSWLKQAGFYVLICALPFFVLCSSITYTNIKELLAIVILNKSNAQVCVMHNYDICLKLVYDLHV